MSASREKKARQELNESGYVDPRKAREAEEKAKERRSTRIYTAVIVAFVLLGVVLFASHDHEFVQTVANRIMEFVDGKLIDKMGTYDEYIGGIREEMLARLNG